jgi:hypothetical protein
MKASLFLYDGRVPRGHVHITVEHFDALQVGHVLKVTGITYRVRSKSSGIVPSLKPTVDNVVMRRVNATRQSWGREA